MSEEQATSLGRSNDGTTQITATNTNAQPNRIETTKGPVITNGLTVDEATNRVHLALRALLLDELPDLAQSWRSSGVDENTQYFHLTLTTVKNYFMTTYKTWMGVLFSFGKIFVGGVSPIDFMISLTFSICITIILTAGMLICIVAKIPFVGRIWDAYARLHGGVSFINILNSGMFMNFSDQELQLAKDAISSVQHPDDHVMNIDIAKLLLLFSGLVYERSIEAKRQAIRSASRIDSPLRSTLPPNHQRPFFRQGAGQPASTSSFPTANESPRGSPTQPQPLLYGTFPSELENWREEFLHQPPYSSPTETTVLSQTSATQSRSKSDQPSGPNVLSGDSLLLHQVMKKWGFEYQPVSELDTASSAYTAAFWDKNSNWVVISFKGTSPPEFDEWLVDCDYTRVDIGEYIPGFSTAHHGFKNRLFPDVPTLNRTPYETIVEALKVITSDLLSRTDKGFVNVYITGHSLGSGIASLAFSRAIQKLDGLDERVRICDAYFFSSPIVSDIDSAMHFNQSIVSYRSGPRTVWRFVNHWDAVATLIPAMGDDPQYPYPESLFAFAHLGTQVKMRRNGTKSIAENHYAPDSTQPSTVSGLPPETVGNVPEGMKVPIWMIWAQYIPLAGWMFSHFPGLYMESLQAMETGEMEWTRKKENK